jgi:hypothetical protein
LILQMILVNNEDNPFLLRVSSLKTASVLEANLIQAQANFEIATGKHTSKEIEAIRLKSQNRYCKCLSKNRKNDNRYYKATNREKKAGCAGCRNQKIG